MNEKPKNISQAINELEHGSKSNGESSAADFQARLKSEIKNLEETLTKLRPHLEDISSRVSEEAKKAKSKVENEVQKNPWAAIGVVGLLFFVLGLLFGLKGSRRND